MGFCGKAYNLFVSFDLFGIRPSLYFQGKRKTGTNFGFCLTVLLVTFTTICFGYFGQDLFYRENPNLRYHEEYCESPEKITIDPELTPIIIELNSLFGDQYYTDRKLLHLNVSQFTINATNSEVNVMFDTYPMETCTKNHFSKLDPKTQAYFLHKKLEDYFCIPRELKNLTMQGAFDQPFFQAIKFTASICSNDSFGNISCLPTEEIKKTMQGGFIGIYFVDFTIDPSNYNTPKIAQPREVFTNFVLNSQKQIDIFFRNNYIETEDGLIFQNKYQQKISNFIDSKEFNFQTESNDFLMVFFKIKQEISHYKRNYTKLQNLLAQIGGFINCFWIFSFIINYLYTNLYIISKVVTNIFTVLIPREINKKKNQEYPKIFKIDESITQTLSNLSKKQDLIKNKDSNETKGNKIEIEFINSKSNQTSSELNNENKNFLIPPVLEKKDLIQDPTLSNMEVIINSKVISNENQISSTFSTKKIAEIEKIHQLEKEVEEFKTIEELNLGILDYFYYYTGLLKNPERERKKIIIEKGSSVIRTCLDIKYIIQKFYEIEKLKQILLNENEIEKFENLPKPELKIEEQGQKTKYTAYASIFKKKFTLSAETIKNKKKSRFYKN